MTENKVIAYKEKLKDELSKTRYGLITVRELDDRWKELKEDVIVLGDKYTPKYGIFGGAKCPICNKKLDETSKWVGFSFPIKSILHCICGYEYPNEDWGDE